MTIETDANTPRVYEAFINSYAVYCPRCSRVARGFRFDHAAAYRWAEIHATECK